MKSIQKWRKIKTLIAKDVIEIDRRLWRKFESLALHLANI